MELNEEQEVLKAAQDGNKTKQMLFNKVCVL